MSDFKAFAEEAQKPIDELLSIAKKHGIDNLLRLSADSGDGYYSFGVVNCRYVSYRMKYGETAKIYDREEVQ